jgi:hypothetical protein
MRFTSNTPESHIVDIWQHLLEQRTELTTEEGEWIKIIYPGRVNSEQGADFRDAVIATNRGLTMGDIEVHVKSNEWQAHRHHRNPAYNQVILHVVMWHNTDTAASLQNGESAPTVALDKYLKAPVSQSRIGTEPQLAPVKPCLKVRGHLTIDIIAQLLDSAGEERFLAKAARFEAELAQTEAVQCLYQGIMRALGYSQNTLPFQELAHRVPLQTLESITRQEIPVEECLAQQQALLLGAGGLLPSQRPDRRRGNELGDIWADELERLWDSYYQTDAMSPHTWHLFRVRPNNSPLRRLAAMSYLTLRYREKGILEGVIDIVKEVPIRESHFILEGGLIVTTDGYWANHFDFGGASRTANPTLLGSRRAADITINVLLPFTLAWAELDSQPRLAKKALDLYRHYPKLAANTLERHMKKQLGLNNVMVGSAQRQQGLIHIYHTLCTQGKCHFCPLSQLETGNHIQI